MRGYYYIAPSALGRRTIGLFNHTGIRLLWLNIDSGWRPVPVFENNRTNLRFLCLKGGEGYLRAV